jgi:NAD(P)-dependent dehydrogenase (short-subunit alcohol dehydrogenase family)
MSGPELSNRVVIITGAAGDIGQAMARRFARAGARLALLDRDAVALQARVAEFSELAGAQVLTAACDLADAAAIAATVARIAAHFGAVNALVNNAAAVTPKNTVAELPLADWQHAFDVNVTGAFVMAQAVIPHLRAAGGGVVLNIASQMGHVTAPGQAAYSASKAALLSLTRSIAVDHAAEGVRAVSLSPGAVMTSRLTSRYGDEAAVNAALAVRHPLGRIGRADEIAETALFLLSDGAAFVSGADLLVDGGYTAV